MKRFPFLPILLILFLATCSFLSGADKTAQDYYDSGKTYYQDGRYSDALEAFRNAVELKPDFPAARLFLAKSLKGLGLIRQATAEFKTVRDADPQSPEGQEALKELAALQEKVLSILLLRPGGDLKENEGMELIRLLRDSLRAKTPYEVVYIPEKESAGIAVDCQIARDRDADFVLSQRVIEAKGEKISQDRQSLYKFHLRISASLVEAQYQNHLDYWELSLDETSSQSLEDARDQSFESAAEALLLRIRVALNLKYGLEENPPYLELKTGVPELRAYALGMPEEQALRLPVVIVTPFVDHSGSYQSIAEQGTAYLRNVLFYSGKYAVIFEKDFSQFFPYPLKAQDSSAFEKVIGKINANYLLLPHIDWMSKEVGGFIVGSRATVSGRIHMQVAAPNTGKILNEWESKDSQLVGTYLFKSTESLAKDPFYSDMKFLLLALIDNLRVPFDRFIELNFVPPQIPPKKADGFSGEAPQPDYGELGNEELARGVRNLKDARQIFLGVKKALKKDLAWESELYYRAARMAMGRVKNYLNPSGVQYAVFFPTTYTPQMIIDELSQKHLIYLNQDVNSGAVAVNRTPDGENVVILLKKR